MKQYLFDFDACYRDQNLIFVFDHSTRIFLISDIFIKAATIVNDEYWRYGKNFDINAFFTDWFVSKKKGNGVVIGNYKDYQELPANKKYLIPLMQTNNRLYIRWGAIFFTCLKKFKGADTIIHKSQHFRSITIPPHHLAQLRTKFKNFCLTSFDECRCDRDTITTCYKNDIQHNRFYAWPECWLGGFLKSPKPLYKKWFIAENDAHIFNYDINKDLAKLGGIQQAEQELDENVLEIKNLVKENRWFIKNYI